MDLTFGEAVQQEAQCLASSGRDPNQIAQIVFEQDPHGYNYGIGIILDGDGRPMGSSSTLLEYTEAELAHSREGAYMTSSALMDDLKAAALRWQRIPETHHRHFLAAVPSDAGTGAVRTAIDIALLLYPHLKTLGLEELGWPAYKAMASVKRIGCKEFADDAIMTGEHLLPVYQAGPMNTTGQVRAPAVIVARAVASQDQDTFVILDRAYSGFEFARFTGTHTYDDIMRMSYERQIQPFIDRGVPFTLAISPTKSFVTFALRPCGLLLLYCPDDARREAAAKALNIIMRARGSGFEHPVTRAFVKALAHDLSRLENEHLGALRRLATAEARWAELAADTPIVHLFSDQYAGLFRNLRARDGAAAHIYNEHLYPVLAGGRCRLNTTGIPDDDEVAKRHVAVFAEYCY